MCGIVGIVSKKQNIIPLLVEGLEKLEYRGYDSTGIAFAQNNEIKVVKATGKLQCLVDKLKLSNYSSEAGIGHTRWATHGEITIENAHPLSSGKVSVVHNGIVENYLSLRNYLATFNIKCSTETDTEVIPKLLNLYLQEGSKLEEAVYKTISKIEGTFAIAALIEGGTIVCAKRGKNLVLGYGNGTIYLASDAYTLSLFTSRITYLEDDDYALLNPDGCLIFNKDCRVFRLETTAPSLYFNSKIINQFKYPHIILQEIFEQPTVIAETLNNFDLTVFDKLSVSLETLTSITIIACGSSYFAAYIAKYWLENFAEVRLHIEFASEFRYKKVNLLPSELIIFLSQSGETADTYAALKFIQEKNYQYISITNMPESSIARATKLVLFTKAGPELSVAATKTFTAQLLILLYTTKIIAEKKNIFYDFTHALESISYYIEATLQRGKQFLEKAITIISMAKSVIYMGRGASYGVALEGALKLKELSYIHAEALPAGELKHGPIALISEEIPIIAIAPFDYLFEKILSNIAEVRARKGKIIVLTDAKGTASLMKLNALTNLTIIEMPSVPTLITPIIYTIPLQLLAYYVALEKGNDVDRPRNLAKSVTVE